MLLRMIQGFSAGGEYAGAAVFMSEHAPDNRRGFYGSFLEFGTLAGFSAAALLCTGLTFALGDEAMHAWGWRVPFALTLLLGIIALWMRRSLDEPETFTKDLPDANKGSNKTSHLINGALRWRVVVKGVWFSPCVGGFDLSKRIARRRSC